MSVIEQNNKDVGVRGSNHSILVSKGGSMMEVQLLPLYQSPPGCCMHVGGDCLGSAGSALWLRLPPCHSALKPQIQRVNHRRNCFENI